MSAKAVLPGCIHTAGSFPPKCANVPVLVNELKRDSKTLRADHGKVNHGLTIFRGLKSLATGGPSVYDDREKGD